MGTTVQHHTRWVPNPNPKLQGHAWGNRHEEGCLISFCPNTGQPLACSRAKCMPVVQPHVVIGILLSLCILFQQNRMLRKDRTWLHQPLERLRVRVRHGDSKTNRFTFQFELAPAANRKIYFKVLNNANKLSAYSG